MGLLLLLLFFFLNLPDSGIVHTELQEPAGDKNGPDFPPQFIKLAAKKVSVHLE